MHECNFVMPCIKKKQHVGPVIWVRLRATGLQITNRDECFGIISEGVQLMHCRRVAAAGSYFWGGLVRIDVMDAPVSTSLAFYGPRTMRVTSSPLLDDSSDHLSAVSAKSADVSSSDSSAVGPQADSAAGSSAEASRSSQRTADGEATSSSGRESDPEGLFGIEGVRSRGGLRIVKEVRPGTTCESNMLYGLEAGRHGSFIFWR